MRAKYPGASFKQAHWGAFRPTTFIDPVDPLFTKLGKARRTRSPAIMIRSRLGSHI